jgi:cobalt-precorrin 5A hydrolase
MRAEPIAVITLSVEGFRVAARIREELGEGVRVYVPPEPGSVDIGSVESGSEDRGIADPGTGKEIVPFTEGVRALTASLFHTCRGLVFVMPMGVVLRAICPHMRDKRTDPAVVTVDAAGRYAISTLSGHEGGANVLAERVARALNTDFVVTTSTEAAKSLVLGVGCRRGVSAEDVGEAVSRALDRIGSTMEEVRVVATVSRKKNEPGLLRFCEERGIPLRSISVDEIRESRIRFRESPFVREVLGIGAVAVPCALLGGRKTELILDRIEWKKVTAAVAREHFDW